MSNTGWHRPIKGSQQQRSPPVPGERREFPNRRVLCPGGDLSQYRRRTIEERSNGLPPPYDIPATGNHQPFGFDPHFPRGKGAQPSTHIEVGNGTGSGMVGEQNQPQPCHPKPSIPGKNPNLARAEEREIEAVVRSP